MFLFFVTLAFAGDLTLVTDPSFSWSKISTATKAITVASVTQSKVTWTLKCTPDKCKVVGSNGTESSAVTLSVSGDPDRPVIRITPDGIALQEATQLTWSAPTPPSGTVRFGGQTLP